MTDQTERPIAETPREVVDLLDGIAAQEQAIAIFPSEALALLKGLTLLAKAGPPKAIVVWEFKDAPEDFRKLSPHGGDEDWVAVLPKEYKDSTPLWMETGTAFGCCDVSRHELEDGRIVCIGCHA